MSQETKRTNVSQNHIKSCNKKLDVLNEQNNDLCIAIDELVHDIESGNKYMKTYKQMKMYNDEDLNPVLYKIKS